MQRARRSRISILLNFVFFMTFVMKEIYALTATDYATALVSSFSTLALSLG